LLLGPLNGHRALPLQPDVTVRVDKARHQPHARGDGLCVADRRSADYSVDHPEIPMFTLRQHHTSEVKALPFNMLSAHDREAPSP
jgi:hypothetical protein